jgi:hypothetical protein
LLTLHQRPAGDFRDTLQIGAALFGDGRLKWAAGPAGPEVLWLLGPEGLATYDRLVSVEPETVVRQFDASGFVVLRDGWTESSSYVFVDAGAHGAMNYVHAHADALSFEYASNGVTWIVDPGTYTYTKDPALRDQFRTSSAHNTLLVAGQSQSQPNGPFSWSHVAHTRLHEVTAGTDAATCMAEHNGYERLDPPVRHRRWIRLLKRPDRPSGSYLLIEDRVRTFGSYRYQLRFHLAAGCKTAKEDGRFVVHHENGQRLAVGMWLVGEGWVSPEYARRVAAPVLTADAEGTGDCTFVTAFAVLEGEAAIDLERLARLNVEQDVLAA